MGMQVKTSDLANGCTTLAATLNMTVGQLLFLNPQLAGASGSCTAPVLGDAVCRGRQPAKVGELH